MEYLNLAQVVGYISFILGISTFYQKDDRKLKIVMVVFNLNHMLHYLLLGSIVSALRSATAIYVSSKVVAGIFIFISLVSGVWLSNSIWEFWPILGTIIGTYSVFILKGIQMRIGFLIGATCWLVNNMLVGSIGGTLLEVTLISVNVMTIFRLLKDQQQTLATSKQ
ncbi:YgjV family protein [Vibrio sp. YMD68]|uniref:YgjV family protein n=1 Tax=Vibrio sp. YMD68 TaxID=3042300 RepID=UPI00249BDBAC|nr:YgjV family protein [Vibrio sp. YMD68]WGW01391.1 YgjV family protein [Vibrio sp. YMD68]